jgi:hypothetical protein
LDDLPDTVWQIRSPHRQNARGFRAALPDEALLIAEIDRTRRMLEANPAP